MVLTTHLADLRLTTFAITLADPLLALIQTDND
jgi:hypothetical protein